MTYVPPLDGTAGDEVAIRVINLGTDWSAGDNVTVYTANPDGRKLVIHDGTAASPTSEAHPTSKVSRVSSVSGGITGDGSTELAAFYGSSSGTTASKVQEIGLVGSAKNAGTEGEPDACGIYGVGRILSGGKGRAFGGFLLGRRDGEEQRATGAEIAVENLGGADSYDILTGAETTKGIWLHGGTAKSAVGIQVGTVSEAVPSFDVALGVNKFSIATAVLQDNSSALRSIQIKGSHEKAAISVASGSGQVVIGAEEAASATPLFEVFAGETAFDPLIDLGTGKGVSVSTRLIRNSTGNMKCFAANASNAFLTGTVQGDVGFNFTAGKTFHIGAQTKTSQLRIGEASIGFYGVAPVARSAAYTQTYATTSRTQANPKAEAVSETPAALTLFGYGQAQADAIPKAINKLIEDVANVKQIVNSVVDDFQANGMFQ